MSESQTPRTDAAAFNLNPDGSIQYSPKGGWVGRDTCEQLESELTATRARLAEAAGANKEMGDALEKICNMLGAVGPAQAIVEALDIWMGNYDKMFTPCENGHGLQAECYGCQRDAALSRLAELEGIAEALLDDRQGSGFYTKEIAALKAYKEGKK